MSPKDVPPDRGNLLTERVNPRSAELDRLSPLEAVDLMNREDASVAAAVAAERLHVAAAVELVTAAFRAGGRLIYVGAGTSGRLGVLDASECPPTFHSPPEQVRAIIAGGPSAVFAAVEGAEDDAAAGERAVCDIAAGRHDVVLGIAAGGTTPFVLAALAAAKRRGAGTVFLACVEGPRDLADVVIRPLTGPEVLTGSTRLKAGTATKLVLNTISTLAMVGLGKVHGNLMVDLRATNRKLEDRAARIVSRLTGLSRAEAFPLISDAGGRVKTAVVMHKRGVTRPEAEALLDRFGGRLRDALEASHPPDQIRDASQEMCIRVAPETVSL
jgi:N-acetylmuramic acid 6-phosphate etherase